ncbi:MAG: CapA family protein [Oscillospiraceae bacterium]|nr:CapA family protein [Oscillospiraceae bacterium]
MKEQMQSQAAEKPRLKLKQRILILSRRDRMGKAMPTWYRVLAVCVVLIAVLVLLSAQRRERLTSRLVPPEPLTEGTNRLSFCGDLDLDGNVEVFSQRENRELLYQGVAPLWQDSDAVFACLDGVVLSALEQTPERVASFDTAVSVLPEAVNAAVNAGINAFALANDHTFDYGSRGVEQTVAAMNALSVFYAGAGEDLPTAGACRFMDVNGLRIGFLSCSAVNPNAPGPIDDYTLTTTAYSALYRNVFQAKAEADLVVVYVCWGELNALSVSESQRRIAHQFIQSGADIVIGTHTHVLQPVEHYEGGWVFYGLGDLISDRDQRGERESALLRLDFDRQTGNGSFTLIPLLLEDFCPAPTTNSFYVNQIHHSLLRELPDGSYTETEDGRIQIPVHFP